MTSEEYRAIRRKIGLTQVEAAKYLGMTQQAISRIESGTRQPTSQQAAAIRLLAIIKEHKSKRRQKSTTPS